MNGVNAIMQITAARFADWQKRSLYITVGGSEMRVPVDDPIVTRALAALKLSVEPGNFELTSARYLDPAGTILELTVDGMAEPILPEWMDKAREFVSAAGVEITPANDLSDEVKPSLSARQLRLWLVRNGVKLAEVEAAIDGLPEDKRDEARIEWEYATEYERDNPLIDTIGALLNLTEEKIDAGFKVAANY